MKDVKKGAKKTKNRNKFLHCVEARCVMSREKRPFRSDRIPNGCDKSHCNECDLHCSICDKECIVSSGKSFLNFHTTAHGES